MVEPIRAIQCLMEASEREMLNLTNTIRPSALGRVEVEDNEDHTDGSTALCDGLSNSPFLQTLQPFSLRSAKVFGYRGEKVAGFDVGGKRMICLPQAYQLFLKDLVGGLHTVYTKLRRLNITPLTNLVEQVRSLRSLGAIQPGVNRCKLIEDSDFDHLYNDCNTLGSRPGRPPKRGWSGSGWRPEEEEEEEREAQRGDYFYRRNRLDLDNGDGGGEVAPTSTHSAIPTLQTESALSSVGSWLAQQQSTINAFQLLSGGFLLPTQQQDPQFLIRRMMAVAAATLSTQPQTYPPQLLCENLVNQEIGSSNEAESVQVAIENSELNRGDGEEKHNENETEAVAPTVLCPPDAALLHPNSVEQRDKRSKSLDRRLLPDGGKPQWNLGSEGSTNGSTAGSASSSRSTMDRSVDNEREKFLSQSASWGSSQYVDAAFDNEQQGIRCVVSKVTAMEITLKQLQEKIDALIDSKAVENVAEPQNATRANSNETGMKSTLIDGKSEDSPRGKIDRFRGERA